MKQLFTILLSVFTLFSVQVKGQSIEAIVELSGYDPGANASGYFYFNGNEADTFLFDFNPNGVIATELPVPTDSGIVHFEFQNCYGEIQGDISPYEVSTNNNIVFEFEWCPDTSSTCSLESVVEVENYDSTSIYNNGSFYFSSSPNDKFTYDFSNDGRIAAAFSEIPCVGVLLFEYEDCNGNLITLEKAYNTNVNGNVIFTDDWCDTSQTFCGMEVVVELSNYNGDSTNNTGSFYFSSNPNDKFTDEFSPNGRVAKYFDSIPCQGIIYFEFENCFGELITLQQEYDASISNKKVFVNDYCVSEEECVIEAVVEYENFNAEDSLAGTGSFFFNSSPNDKFTYQPDPNGRIGVGLTPEECSGVLNFEFEDCNGNYQVVSVDFDADSSDRYVFTPNFCPELPPQCEAFYEIEQARNNNGDPIPGELVVYDRSVSLQGHVVEWFWNFGDGDTSSDVTPRHTYSDNGPYALCLTITDNGEEACTSTYCDTIEVDNEGNLRSGFTITVIRTQATNTEEVAKENLFVYPNPINSNSTLYFSHHISDVVRIYSLTGNLLHQTRLHQSNQLDLSILNGNKGVYIVMVAEQAFRISIIK